MENWQNPTILEIFDRNEKKKLLLPFTPNMSRHADCAGSCVPPPTVPISIEGIVHDMYKSFPSSPHGSIKVIQLLLPTFCAGSLKYNKLTIMIKF